jgi:hypothetical protein
MGAYAQSRHLPNNLDFDTWAIRVRYSNQARISADFMG